MQKLDHESLALMMEAGYVYVGMQRFKEARGVFEGVAALAPESEIPLIALGSVDFCQAKFASAIRHYKKALELEPESQFARAYMGETLLFMGKKKDALEMLKSVAAADRKGTAGAFAASLLDAVEKGYTPEDLSSVKEVKELEKRQKSAGGKKK